MISDVRQAWRMIWRMPGLAAVVIVSLGVGIGVNTAVFSWIQAMVLEPIPGIVDAGGVQRVEPRADTGSYPGASWAEYRDLRDRMRTLPDLFAFRMVPFNIGESGGRNGRRACSYPAITFPPSVSARRSAASCVPTKSSGPVARRSSSSPIRTGRRDTTATRACSAARSA